MAGLAGIVAGVIAYLVTAERAVWVRVVWAVVVWLVVSLLVYEVTYSG